MNPSHNAEFRRLVTKRGFSFIEILISLAVLSIILTIGLAIGPNNKVRAKGSAEAAKIIAERLRAARSQAQATGEPVAVVFPSESGSLPHSQSHYILSGEAAPKLSRVFDTSQEYPDVVTFIGLWSGPDNTVTPPPDVIDNNKFDASSWFRDKDYQFVFTPSGGVITNNLPLFDDDYHIVVCTGVQYTPTAQPGSPQASLDLEPSYFELTKASGAHTIVIGQSGEVSIVKGVASWQGSEDRDLDQTVAPAPAFISASAEGSAPEILALEILPDQAEALLPPNTDAVVRDGQFLTLRLRASHPGGGPLYCEMESRDPQDVPSGAFTAPSKRKMDWNPTTQEWEFTAIWSPPLEHPVGTRYTVHARVNDETPIEVSTSVAAAPIVEKTSGGRMLLASTENHGPGFLAVVNDDGTQYRRLPQDLDILSGQIPVHFSPDGKSAVFKDTHGNTAVTDLETLVTDRYPHPTYWSWQDSGLAPDGSRFVVEHWNSGETQFFLHSFVDSVSRRLYPSLGNPSLFYDDPAISPDGRKLSYVLGYTLGYGQKHVVVEDWDQNTNTLSNARIVHSTVDNRVNVHHSFSPDSSTVLVTGANPRNFFIAQSDGSGSVRVPGQALEMYHSQPFDWSPDGTRIAYYTDSDSINILEIASGQITTFPIPDPLLDARYLRWSR